MRLGHPSCLHHFQYNRSDLQAQHGGDADLQETQRLPPAVRVWGILLACIISITSGQTCRRRSACPRLYASGASFLPAQCKVQWVRLAGDAAPTPCCTRLGHSSCLPSFKYSSSDTAHITSCILPVTGQIMFDTRHSITRMRTSIALSLPFLTVCIPDSCLRRLFHLLASS